jgi:hypothetical protein
MFQKETNLAFSKKVAAINHASRSREVLKLAQSQGGDYYAQLYQGDKFVRNLSNTAVERRFLAVKPKNTSDRGSRLEQADQLSLAEVKRRQDIIRSALLDTINLENRLKDQLSVLKQNSRMSPFVIE